MQKKISSQEIKNYLRGGVRVSNNSLVIIYHKKQERKSVAVIISKKKIKNAVKRNYVRRVIRSLAQSEKELKGIFIFIYKSKETKNERIQKVIQDAIKTLKDKLV